MQKHMNGLWFRLMALEYRLRSDNIQPILERAGIRRGMSILDFGCGPGRYTLPAARLAGAEGAVYAVDVQPLALKMVERKARRERMSNVRTILTDCETGLPSGSIDVVLLINALHDAEERGAVLKELRRVLKRDGTVRYADHTLFGERLDSLMASCGFRRADVTPDLLTFQKT